MKKNHIEPLRLLTCHCDMYGAWKPSSILETMQEVSGAHCQVLGIGREELKNIGLTWILSRIKLEMKRIPMVGEQIFIETYPTPTRHMFFMRSSVFRDERGKEIGHANSMWMLMDIETRRAVRAPYVEEKLPDNRDLQSAAGFPSTVRLLQTEPAVQNFIPQFTDFDTNLHVNNTKYLDWCCNALGMSVMEQFQIMSFDINYESEIKASCKVRTELQCEGERFCYCGFNAEGKRLFAIGGTMVRRS